MLDASQGGCKSYQVEEARKHYTAPLVAPGDRLGRKARNLRILRDKSIKSPLFRKPDLFTPAKAQTHADTALISNSVQRAGPIL